MKSFNTYKWWSINQQKTFHKKVKPVTTNGRFIQNLNHPSILFLSKAIYYLIWIKLYALKQDRENSFSSFEQTKLFHVKRDINKRNTHLLPLRVVKAKRGAFAGAIKNFVSARHFSMHLYIFLTFLNRKNIENR